MIWFAVVSGIGIGPLLVGGEGLTHKGLEPRGAIKFRLGVGVESVGAPVERVLYLVRVDVAQRDAFGDLLTFLKLGLLGVKLFQLFGKGVKVDVRVALKHASDLGLAGFDLVKSLRHDV